MCALAVSCGGANDGSLFGTTGETGAGGQSPGAGGVLGAGGVTGAAGVGPIGAGGLSGSGGALGGSGGSASGGQGQGGVAQSGGLPSSGGAPTGGRPGSGGVGSGGAAPSCGDGVQNGSETDADCGGSMCRGCAPGKRCLTAHDCDSLVCFGGLLITRTCLGPSCVDGVKNGAETDVDCGGAQCGRCSNGQMCLVNADCTSTHCVSGVCTCKKLTCDDIAGACGPNVQDGCGGKLTCTPCSTLCTDGKFDGNETDTDCGGSDCKRCSDDEKCKTGSDCESGVCMAAASNAPPTCRAPTCTDGVLNGAETDVDCGGSTCPPCATGKVCAAATDCVQHACEGGKCACKKLTCSDYPAGCGTLADGCGSTIDCNSCKDLCMDGMQDGHETDVDCGGPDCDPCDTGLHCQNPGDCISQSCDSSGGGPDLVCQ